MFGMTETANWIGGGVLDDALGRDGYVGSSWEGDLAVLTDAGISQTGRGEVLVRTAGLMDGFWDAPDMTREAFTAGWFRSGDIGELATDGSLTLLGRLKTEINCAGIKILAEEVDMLLERHPAVAQACAFALDDPVSGEVVGAAVVREGSGDLDVEKLRKWAGDRARPDAVPRHIFLVEAIPLSDRGKIIRDAVRAQCLKETGA